MNRRRLFPGCFCWLGWILLLILLLTLLPKALRHFSTSQPAVQQKTWNEALAEKKLSFERPWKDSRPLIIMAGDSHVEMGDWYEGFHGGLAVRNCGFSGAKIEDVTTLVNSISDRNAEVVMLICGINNLSRGDSIESCIHLYQDLLSTVESRLHPKKIIVLSVMPLRLSWWYSGVQTLNQKVDHFNRSLKELCAQKKNLFVDTSPALTDAAGGLAVMFTNDGLHLNQAGYVQLIKVIQPVLFSRWFTSSNDSH